MQKLCSRCNKWKKQSEYYKSRSSKDGLMVTCRECTYKPGKKKKEKGKDLTLIIPKAQFDYLDCRVGPFGCRPNDTVVKERHTCYIAWNLRYKRRL